MYRQFSTELHYTITFQNGLWHTENFIHQRSLGKQGKKNEKLHLPLQWNSLSPPSSSTCYKMPTKSTRLKVKTLK